MRYTARSIFVVDQQYAQVVMGFCESRIDLQGSPVRCHRRRYLAEGLPSRTEVVVRLGIRRLQRDRLFQPLDGCVASAAILERHAEQGTGWRAARVDGHSLARGAYRLVVAVLPAQDPAQADKSADPKGIDRESCSKRSGRFVEPRRSHEQKAEIDMRRGLLRLQFQGTPQTNLRLGNPAGLHVNDGQIVKRIGMSRIVSQESAIDRLSLGYPALAMMALRLGEESIGAHAAVRLHQRGQRAR